MRLPWNWFFEKKKFFFLYHPGSQTLKLEAPGARVIGVARNVRATRDFQGDSQLVSLTGVVINPKDNIQVQFRPLKSIGAAHWTSSQKEDECFEWNSYVLLCVSHFVCRSLCICFFPLLAPFSFFSHLISLFFFISRVRSPLTSLPLSFVSLSHGLSLLSVFSACVSQSSSSAWFSFPYCSGLNGDPHPPKNIIFSLQPHSQAQLVPGLIKWPYLEISLLLIKLVKMKPDWNRLGPESRTMVS